MNPGLPMSWPLGLALLIALSPLALAGLAVLNTGLGRARSAAHAMLASLAVMAVAAIVFCLWGFSWAGMPLGAVHQFAMGGVAWDWMGRGHVLLRGVPWDEPGPALFLLLQIFAVGMAVMIPLSAGAERWKLSSCCASAALLAGCTYPLFAHWVWGGGWLAQMGVHFRLGAGFVDAGGSGTVQVVGGLTALAITLILGPRRGRYMADGMAAAIPGHNIIYVLFGCLVMVPGWIGLNGAGAMLFAAAGPERVALVALNTVLSACAALIAAGIVTRVRFGRPDASLSANGWVGGLVASSASCAFVPPMAAIAIGLVAGLLVTASVEVLEVRLAVDDPGGAVSVHAVAGIWGLLAVGIFARIPVGYGMLHAGATSSSGQMLAQVVGVATLVGLVFPLTYGLNWALDRISPQRVESEGERVGMDLHQLGAGAYPEFSVYNDEGARR